MSQFTTEVRYICEYEAGLTSSVGYDKVEDVLSKSWNHIFTNFPIFDESYRQGLCTKILRHYYTREICAESVGLWKLWLNGKMNEIMPYYNELYKTTLYEFDPLKDTDYTVSGNKSGENSKNNTNKTTANNKREDDFLTARTDNLTQKTISNNNEESSSNVTTNTDNTNWDLYSKTPQGTLNGVENQTYLTEARKISDNGTSTETASGNTESNGTNTQTNSGTQDINNSGTSEFNETRNDTGSEHGDYADEYMERITGKRGGQSYVNLIVELRESLLNIDMMIIDELSELFFSLWEG